MASTSTPDARHVDYLYRARGAGGRLLYVGITWDLRLRMRVHSRHAPWWAEVVCFDLEQFSVRDQALRAERAAIAQEQPIYNIVRPNPNARRGKYLALRARLAAHLGEDPVTYGQGLRRDGYTSWARTAMRMAEVAGLSPADAFTLNEALPAWVRTGEDSAPTAATAPESLGA